MIENIGTLIVNEWWQVVRTMSIISYCIYIGLGTGLVKEWVYWPTSQKMLANALTVSILASFLATGRDLLVGAPGAWSLYLLLAMGVFADIALIMNLQSAKERKSHDPYTCPVVEADEEANKQRRAEIIRKVTAEMELERNEQS